jgi:glycosyltransferase involved in cell wall biosynthesis
LFKLPVLPGLRSALRWLAEDIRQVAFTGNAVKLVFQFLAGAKVAYILRRHEVSDLHIHFAHVPTQIGMYGAALAGVSFTVMAHANDIFERGLLLPTKARRAKKFLTISEFNQAYLLRKGVSASDMALVRCGVSFPARIGKASFEFSGRPRVGTLGRLVEKKGFDVLLRAVARLRAMGLDPELSIAGDGPLKGALESMVVQLKLESAVRFEGGLSHMAVQAWMHTLDMFVLPCKPDSHGDMDGIPVVLMEAMSQQVPVVSTRLSGIPELILDGQTGLLAEPNNDEDLAQKIAVMLSSAKTRERLAIAGEQHVRSEFGQEVNLGRLIGHIVEGRA